MTADPFLQHVAAARKYHPLAADSLENHFDVPSPAEPRTYSIQIKGEQHTWLVDAWTKLSYEQLCQILSDLTGYKAQWIACELIFDDLGYATQTISIAQEGEAPMFLIRSSDGGKP